MIQSKFFHAVVCDHCGVVNGDGGNFSYWDGVNGALDVARDSDWLIDVESNKHYCTECFYLDENDMKILHPERKKEFPKNNQIEDLILVLKPLAELDLTGVTSEIIYARDKTQIKVADVMLARATVKYLIEIMGGFKGASL